MPKVLRPIGHEDRLSIVDHLDELRSRLFVCGAALAVAFGLCFWQNQVLLNLLNKPLPPPSKTAANHLGGLTKDNVSAAKDLSRTAVQLRKFSASPRLSPTDSATVAAAANDLQAAARALPQKAPKNVPITI